MIKSVTVTNYVGDTLTLELKRPEKSGFLIYDITGLGPGKSDINTSEIATSDGSFYNSARLGQRNIVIMTKFLFSPTVEDTRHRSYKYFPIKKPIKLRIETDNRSCEIEGYVESNEPVIFNKEEYTQISIVCPDPYFYSTKTDTTVFYGIVPMFEFPFSNESLVSPIIGFGEIQNHTAQTVYYQGDSDVGITIFIKAMNTVKNITIYNTNTREIMRIDTDKLALITGSGLVTGDEVIISTVKGKKSIVLLRDGLYTNIMNCLDKRADWFQLAKGDNVFAYTADEGINNIQFRVENKVVYEGV